LKDAKKYAKEVHKALSGKKYKRYLKHIYGNEPDQWDETLEGEERLRLITNYLTRMRYCKANGQLELQTRAKADNVFALDTGYAWGGSLTLMRLEDQQRFVVDA